MLKFIRFQLAFQFLILSAVISSAQANASVCQAQDRNCVITQLIEETQKIENPNWRDQSYREIAKSLAGEGFFDAALEIWVKIENPDTKALTIRGIGMAAADHNLEKSRYDGLFAELRAKSETIEHPQSYAIALTYVAMAQAFAKDDEGAWATAASMENDALRHKAYGETAEIQAEMGNVDAALKSIGFIGSKAYRNKSYALVSKILADQALFDQALEAAGPLTNAYKKAKALQYVLDKQKQAQDKAKQAE